MAESKFDYLVNVSEAAFQSMVIATIESYLVHGRINQRRRNHRETYGLLWGYETKTTGGQTCFNVEVATVDANADRSGNSVHPSDNLKIVNETIPAYWPNLRYLGDFHSHPYRLTDSWPKRPFLSEEDRRSVENNENAARTRFSVALLLTIQKLTKQAWKAPEFPHGNTLEFRMNKLRLSLAAWVALDAKNNEGENTRFLVPRPASRNSRDWKEEKWHQNYRHLRKKRVWINAPVHSIVTRLG
jgi:proteasome lid subunit RPN8/RPN11